MTPHVSVVVVSYNSWEATTGPCLESLLSDDRSTPFEIVVVDNASRDATPDRLRALARTQPRLRPLINRDNRGFAGGNNDGVDAARGEVVVLLNSDTRVLPGAVGILGDLLRRHPGLGMVGPVTNAAGNEQQVFCAGEAPEAVLDAGRTWCCHAGGDLWPSRRLDFFCVALPRRLYLELGGLDESFGPGYYEDTDFSLRALAAGVAMGFTEAAFVYHRGGQSFSAKGRAYVRRLMRENRERLKAKHPGRWELRHQRDCNLDVLEGYARQAEAMVAPPPDGLVYRFDNRLQLARGLIPRGPVKRWRYRRRLHCCLRSFYRRMGAALPFSSGGDGARRRRC